MDLTIVIPTRNRHGRLIDCVYALAHNHADILVVDDASEGPVVLPPGEARVIRHIRRLGRSAAINTGIEAARHDAVLVIDDDIYAAPDMVARLMKEFTAHKNPKLALTARVAWDPDVERTLTMSWMEAAGKFTCPILMSRSFLMQHGGFDENFAGRLEATELGLRLNRHGFEMRRLDAATAFQHRVVTVRNLIDREFNDGASAVFLHAKYPQFMPEIDDTDLLLQNEARGRDASNAVDELTVLENAGPPDTNAVADLYTSVCRHYFLRGVFNCLRDIGGVKARRKASSTLAIYKQASHLEETGELDEARRLFRLVRDRTDQKYWDGAEYHLGCIEMALRNPDAAHNHFIECLTLNPAHSNARRVLFAPAGYREVEPNVFTRIESLSRTKILFIVFGDLGHVVNAFPVVAALGRKFKCETAWLTSAEYAELARASLISEVHRMKSRSAIPWSWIYEQGFTHVFFPEPGANLDEFERSGLHPTQFMARKCGVQLHTPRPELDIAAGAVSEAEAFLREYRFQRDFFITVSHGDGSTRHWPKSNLGKMSRQTGLPVIVLGNAGDVDIPGTLACPDMSLEATAVLIGWSSFYLGPAGGLSWLATATDTPMGVFFDPHDDQEAGRFLRESRGDERLTQEWSIYTNLRTVVDYIESVTSRNVSTV